MKYLTEIKKIQKKLNEDGHRISLSTRAKEYLNEEIKLLESCTLEITMIKDNIINEEDVQIYINHIRGHGISHNCNHFVELEGEDIEEPKVFKEVNEMKRELRRVNRKYKLSTPAEELLAKELETYIEWALLCCEREKHIITEQDLMEYFDYCKANGMTNNIKVVNGPAIESKQRPFVKNPLGFEFEERM